MYLNVRPRDVLPAALAAAERAVELDDRNAEARMARGLVRAVFLHDWAKDDLDSAIELDPKSGMANSRRGTYF
jgi:hypothetical protein